MVRWCHVLPRIVAKSIRTCAETLQILGDFVSRPSTYRVLSINTECFKMKSHKRLWKEQAYSLCWHQLSPSNPTRILLSLSLFLFPVGNLTVSINEPHPVGPGTIMDREWAYGRGCLSLCKPEFACVLPF